MVVVEVPWRWRLAGSGLFRAAVAFRARFFLVVAFDVGLDRVDNAGVVGNAHVALADAMDEPERCLVGSEPPLLGGGAVGPFEDSGDPLGFPCVAVR